MRRASNGTWFVTYTDPAGGEPETIVRGRPTGNRENPGCRADRQIPR
jgi:hypothetical protein